MAGEIIPYRRGGDGRKGKVAVAGGSNVDGVVVVAFVRIEFGFD